MEVRKTEAKLLTEARFVDTRVGCGYRYVYSDTEYFRPHYHEYYELFLLLDGTVTHEINGERVPLGKGDLVFVRPSDIHDYHLEEGERFSMLNITVGKSTAESLFSYLGAGFCAEALLSARLSPSVRLNESDFVHVMLQMNGIRAIGEEETERLSTALRILLFRMFTRFFGNYKESHKDEAPAWLLALCREMERGDNYIYGTERMLALTNKSREHLARSMKKYMGVTLSEFVNGLRLNFAANMLRNSNHAIAEIVFESGFGNISWASTLFERRYGMTMSAYRKACKEP